MLNLWKKIQEKGIPLTNTPKKKNIAGASATAVNTLIPRYDGPLNGFEITDSDALPLEKCRLNPEMTDILDDENFRMAYVYFQQFLETKSLSEMLYLWHTVAAASSETESSLKQSSTDVLDSNMSYCHDDDEENSSSSASLSSSNRKSKTRTSGRSSPAVQLPSSTVEMHCVSVDSNCDNANNDCLEIAATATTVTTPSSANEIFFKFSDIIRQRIQSKTVHVRGASNRSSLSSTTTPTDEKLTAPFLDVDALKIAVHETLLDLWNEFVRNEWFVRYQIDLLTSRNVTLGDIMYHDTALSYFTQFLEVEGCHNVIEFWLAASNFQRIVQTTHDFDEVVVNQITNDAISIYEKYLSLLASSPLGFGDQVRGAVEEAICDELRGPRADCFDSALIIVISFLRTNYLLPFLSSQHYVHLISEMIRNCTSVMNHSPVSSISDHRVDSSNSYSTRTDPDLMWRRRKQSGLSFGRIDQLGRFQRDIEPDPGRNNESKLGKIMKRLVHNNTARVEEEMAWQVAEMVIKDITDITKNAPYDNYCSSEDDFCNTNKSYL